MASGGAHALSVSGFVPSSPYVMVSPKARNRVSEIFGGGVTVTSNEHDCDRCSASTTVHVTVDTPTGNSDPFAGVHVTFSGGCPPATVGLSNGTGMSAPTGDSTGSAFGQVIVGAAGGGGGGVGAAGLLQPAVSAAAAAAAQTQTANCDLLNPVVSRLG